MHTHTNIVRRKYPYANSHTHTQTHVQIHKHTYKYTRILTPINNSIIVYYIILP